MLDRSIPYFNVLMRRAAGTPPVADASLPDGYSYEAYQAGDEQSWAAIETSVGEFASLDEALPRFDQDFGGWPEEAAERVFFAVSPANEKIGTVASWWCYTGERRDASLYWLGVRPEHQGKGIGKALTAHCLRRFLELEGDVDVYVHTQPWSYRAIGIYLWAGFRFMEDGSYANYQNQNKEAMPVLREWMGEHLQE